MQDPPSKLDRLRQQRNALIEEHKSLSRRSRSAYNQYRTFHAEAVELAEQIFLSEQLLQIPEEDRYSPMRPVMSSSWARFRHFLATVKRTWREGHKLEGH